MESEDTFHLARFHIDVNAAIGGVRGRARHQADGPGYRHDKACPLIG